MATKFTTPNRPLTWLITGSSSGFGLSLARLVQQNGHKLIATSRNPSRTPDLVKEVESKGGKWVALNVDDKDAAKVIEELEAGGEHIDILVNNAGFAIYAPFECFTEDEVRAQMETLYFGPARLIRAALPHMRKRRFGVIVNMSSGAALEGRESMSTYGAGKAAMDGLSRVLLKEVAAFNIRVLTVLLGTFNTNMGNVPVMGKNPVPEDYKDSATDQIMQYMNGGKFDPDGDKDKAMKAVFEVVTGTGIGKGLEAEKFLPLGRDLSARIQLIQDYLSHTVEVLGDVANNVYLEK
ncbi:hypothetical protein B0T17DRAFT_523673 [Bombardia bombarda]|uniref:Uncharacterized protein n=1 Tax=Bombardia bombarda TaxID=252184 RepID=A0AA40C7T9_9PEZI|nr:hypothetical protein B0T17DRAFT_523673 [Bombardia bombarda]